MGADFSRVRFDPLLDYAGVELKQGGVLLDADANELVAALDRRLRALASDVLGRATVGANTPEAFHITVAAGTLAIGRGRMYVDGLLAENHGAANPAQRTFDPLLAEPAYAQPVSYAAQPYLPGAPALPASGRHLVYLDVWNREVTHLEQPDLVESAVGVETSSRVQTVWQVRVLGEEAPAAVGCASRDDEIPGWTAVIAPSTGRLTTGTYEEAAVTDPCELPPTGGYRGLENQLYRVEIHDPGQPGAGATFKWSRDNASVGSRVKSIVSSTELELDSLGRDDVLRFNTGDWVEITNDVREFAQLPGEIRRIEVIEATRRIRFTAALPAALLASPAAGNLRVRRWDQSNIVRQTIGAGQTAPFQDLNAPGSTGVINVPAAGTTLLLENGITVSFSAEAGRGFKRGDTWVFAARTSDATVERLDRAPPRGIHHHTARLAFWDVGSNAQPGDCRTLWPPRTGADCACTECVTPESHASGQLTIQAAVDRVRERGGTVCLHAGQYALREPVRIRNARSLRIKGQGALTVIGAAGSAFAIDNGVAIAIEDLSVISLGQRSAIVARTVAGLLLQQLAVVVIGSNDGRGAAIALGGVAAGVTIRDNLVIARDGIRAVDPELDPPDNDRPVNFLLTAAVRIEDNILWCEQRAVTLAGTVAHMLATRVRGNEVLGCRGGAIGVLGFAFPGASMRIADNTLNINGPGIRCAVDGAWIEGNKLTAARQGDREPTGAGIHLATGLDPSGSDQCQVLANQASGFPEAGVLIEAPTAELIVKLNIIENCGNGILMLESANAGAVSIENNHLHAIGNERARIAGRFTVGIGVARTVAATVAGNTVRQVGLQAAAARGLVAGVAAAGVTRIRIFGNEITEIGPAEEVPATMAGIFIAGPYRHAEMSNNHVDRDAQLIDQDTRTIWHAVNIDDPQPDRLVARVGEYTALRASDTQTVVINRNRAYVMTAVAGVSAAGVAITRGASAALLGNVLVARSAGPAIAAVATGDLMLAQNRCELRGGTSPAIVIAAPAVILNANRVQCRNDIAIRVTNPTKAVTAVANITTGDIQVGGAPLPQPWAGLNIRA